MKRKVSVLALALSVLLVFIIVTVLATEGGNLLVPAASIGETPSPLAATAANGDRDVGATMDAVDDPAISVELTSGVFTYYSSRVIVQAWNAAINAATLPDNAVKVILLKDWNAVNGSFGEGVGFENGALIVPEDRYIELYLMNIT